MDLDAYVGARGPRWARLEQLVGQRRLSGAEGDELLDLYQQVSTDLSVVRSASPDPSVVTYLSLLLTRARLSMVGARTSTWTDLLRFFSHTFPGALYRTRWWWLTCALLNVVFAFGSALSATDPALAKEEFQASLVHHAQSDRPYDRARVQLAYGEVLRRNQQRVEARRHLRAALETFADLRATPLVDRASEELRASGETARKRDPSTLVDLTPMELKVAGLVSQGLSNKDVAAQCWISPRTVAFHLRNVFAKTGVTRTWPRSTEPGHLTGATVR